MFTEGPGNSFTKLFKQNLRSKHRKGKFGWLTIYAEQAFL